MDITATRRRLSVLAVVLVVGASLLLTDLRTTRPLTLLDGDVADGLHEWFARRPWAAHVASAVSFVGSAVVGVPLVLGVVAWCVRRRLHRLTLFALLTPALGEVLERMLKVVVGRERPV